MLLVRLATALRSELGVTVPVAELFTLSTPSLLAARVSSEAGFAGDGLDPVLVLRAGSGQPLFCVHPASGLSWQFVGLAKYLPEDVPLIGLQSPWLTGEGAESFREVVLTYADRVVLMAPQGPIRLLGWSFGGAVAHQLAAELVSRGRTVSFVGMLDARMDAGAGAGSVAGLMAELGHAVTDELTIEEAVAMIRASDGGVIGALEEAQVARIVETYLASDRVFLTARWEAYGGEVLFVDAMVPERGFAGPASTGWRPLTPGLEAVPVECAHSELLDGEVLRVIGPLIADRLG
ncbi:hypothetical protein FL583_05015 [Cryptosporangium phraense]|uniref:Carrier domain-containing protein n=1 Tax=Cryptosporangium phraense TaxID=2593070 RepID=A0A545AY08_9ACTN|nr:hypothetical protein FL583_05015 [Cryptosporangium phraense]